MRLALRRANFNFDTRFSPHITLGRGRINKGKIHFEANLLTQVNEILKSEAASFVADQLILFESQLTPKGPIYKPVFKITLSC